MSKSAEERIAELESEGAAEFDLESITVKKAPNLLD